MRCYKQVLYFMILICYCFSQTTELNKENLPTPPIRFFQQSVLLESFFGQGAVGRNIETFSNREIEDLYGEWIHQSDSTSLWLTTGTDQSIANPSQTQGLEPIPGGININGITSGSLNYMWLLAYEEYQDGYEVVQLFLGNNPLIDIEGGFDYFSGDTISEDVVLPYYQLEYLFLPTYAYAEGELEVKDTVGGELISNYYWFDSPLDQIEIDLSSKRVTFIDATAGEYQGDTHYTLSGSLSPDRIEIEAGVPTELNIPGLTSDFSPVGSGETMVWYFDTDGTGYQIISGEEDYGNEYYYSYSDTTDITWSGDNDSIMVLLQFPALLPFANSDSLFFAYTVENETLNLNTIFNVCEMGDGDYGGSSCYDFFSMFTGVDDLQDAYLDFRVRMNNNDGLSIIKPIEIAQLIELLPNYPNPFNPETTIQFNVSEKTQETVSIQIFDVTGRLVETVINDRLIPGSFAWKWDASTQTSGVYLVMLKTKGITKSQKMLLLK